MEARFDEQSRAMKDLDRDERDQLIQNTADLLPDFADNRLRTLPQSGKPSMSDPKETGEVDDGQADSSTGKRRKLTAVADEAPAQYGKMNKELGSVKSGVSNAVKKLAEVAILRIASPPPRKGPVRSGKPLGSDKQLQDQQSSMLRKFLSSRAQTSHLKDALTR